MGKKSKLKKLIKRLEKTVEALSKVSGLAAAPESPAPPSTATLLAGTLEGAGVFAPEMVAPEAASPDSATLLALAQPFDLDEPAQRLLDCRDKRYPGSHPRYWAIVDFRRRSGLERMFLFDVVAGSVERYLCAHGKGSDSPENNGTARKFSNVQNSNCSSLGIYHCAEPYNGKNGYSLRLDGLESTNSNARERAIVVHGASYVSPEVVAETGRVGRSEGCPAVENRYAAEVIDALKGGSLMILWAG